MLPKASRRCSPGAFGLVPSGWYCAASGQRLRSRRQPKDSMRGAISFLKARTAKMSEIEDLVLGELGKAPEMDPVERGFTWQRGEDVTRLWFKSTTVPPDAFGLCATAVVETIFRERRPAPPDAELARLNRRACFG